VLRARSRQGSKLMDTRCSPEELRAGEMRNVSFVVNRCFESVYGWMIAESTVTDPPIIETAIAASRRTKTI